MRIHRISLQNYRGVASSDITLERNGVTIIQGPNEVGKSSLAEAVQFLLEEPDSSQKRQLKAVKPVNVDVGPSVEVELDTGPYHVIYSKRWLVDPRTNLQILAPVPENLTGRAAHDRMAAILDETLDRALWRALWYQQGEAISQAAIGESQALAAALDAAATGSALGGPEEVDLWIRVQDERLRYFTATGRPTAERTRWEGMIAQLRIRAGELQAQLAALDASAERYRQVRIELERNNAHQTEQVAILERYEDEWNQVAAKQREVDGLSEAARAARVQATEAASAHEERLRLIRAVATANETLQGLLAEDEREAPGLATVRAAQRVARQERDAARKTRVQAEQRSRRASNDFEYLRQILDCEMLTERQGRVARAEEERRQAAAFLEVCRIDDKKLKKIEEASLASAEERARLSAQNPTLQVEALRDLQIVAGEKSVDLRVGQSLETVVTDGAELLLRDTARITVSGGAATEALKNTVQTMEEELSALLEDAGVSGQDPLGQARELVRQRHEADAASKRAAQDLKDDLRDLTPQLLGDKIERAKANIAAYVAERDPSVPLPADLNAARAASEQEAEALEEVRRHENECQDKLEQAETTVATLQDEASRRTGQIDLAGQNVRSAEQQLERARAEASDADLENQQQEMVRKAVEAENDHRTKVRELAAADPDSVASLLTNARAVLDRLHDDDKSRELESARIKTELDVRGEAGLHDQLASVQSELAQLERQKTLTDRRANAAELLYTRLAANRDAAKRAYALPFKRQLDVLGRIVFGSTAAVNIDYDTLEITSRTLDGVTVPYESLSVGAREQLCVLSRLACAMLVSPESHNQGNAGVPAIFDDALGNSDADRLERVGAAFSAASGKSQVIVLTCVPDRYRNIGSARVVYLEHALAPGGT